MTGHVTTRERPILFSAPMVRAILDGRKTQTRRVVRANGAGHVKEPGGHRFWHPGDPKAVLACPYGRPGDLLYVRETWAPCTVLDVCDPPEFVRYRADDSCWGPDGPVGDHGHTEPPAKWRPSIFLPRVCSRLTLKVAAVRVERLCSIIESDIIAEGVRVTDDPCATTLRGAWMLAWERINGRRPGCALADNPWLWVVSFDLVIRNALRKVRP